MILLYFVVLSIKHLYYKQISKNSQILKNIDVYIIMYPISNMNSFNKTEAAVFSCRLCFLRAFPFISLMLTIIYVNYVYHLCTGFRIHVNLISRKAALYSSGTLFSSEYRHRLHVCCTRYLHSISISPQQFIRNISLDDHGEQCGS